MTCVASSQPALSNTIYRDRRSADPLREPAIWPQHRTCIVGPSADPGRRARHDTVSPASPKRAAEGSGYVTAKADADRVHGRFDEAIATYRQALAIDPDYLPARRGLGQVFDLMGRYADARAEYLAGLEGRRQSYEAAPLLWSLAASYVFDRH